MSTLAVVEEIFRETRVPMSVRQIVEHAAGRLPTRSKTPDTVVARDLSMDIKRKGEESKFIRTAPGRYTLRTIWQEIQSEATPKTSVEASPSVTTQVQPSIAAGARPGITTEPAAATAGDSGQGVPFAAAASKDETTDVLAAFRSGRAGPLPARGPAPSEQEKGSHGQ